MSTPGTGYADQLFWKKALPWPLDDDDTGYCTVKYCYDNQDTKNGLNSAWNLAHWIWLKALGGPASKETNHCLRFKEIEVDQKKHPGATNFCLTNDKRWNKAVPGDTLRVSHDKHNRVNRATVGYSKETSAGRNWVVLDTIPWMQASIFVHEIGYILGMIHEHQRVDRDEYIRFRCDKLAGYDNAHARCMQEEHCRIDLMCDNFEMAYSIDFIDALQYVRGGNGGSHDADADLDFESIMIYASDDWAPNEDCAQDKDLSNCPLAKREPGVEQYSWIDDTVWPSKGDVDFVRIWYQWTPDFGNAERDAYLGSRENANLTVPTWLY
ncbi:hypothetical protein BDV95DRAFT_256423 [Massariosphaeria phaeospora]|uniref:Metalloendopeptidase n=1 Tax=Massariosphaeria phaeospora TaxID=100035 RepID=A0A7C8HYP3_9PLEO|nr:hypothetical protein BDV95DRAFT_256423 [Massariosphaeria phaeospora]